MRLKKKLQVHLSALEAHLLHDILTDTNCTVTSLTVAIRAEKSTISRTLSRMQKRGLLRIDTSPDDRRRKFLVATKKGTALYAQMSAAEKDVLDACVEHAPRERVVGVGESLGTLSDGAEICRWHSTRDEHLLVSPLARASRVSGVFESRLWNTDFDATDFHILYLVREYGGEVRTPDLGQLLFLPVSTLGRKIRLLSAAGLVSQRPVIGEGRVVAVVLTEAGRKALERIGEAACGVLEPAATNLTDDAIRRLVTDLETLVWPGISEDQVPLARHLELRCCHSVTERKYLRGFYIERVVREARHFDLPETIFGSDSAAFGLYFGGALRATCEVRPRDGGWEFDHLAVDGLEFGTVLKFLRAVVTHRGGAASTADVFTFARAPLGVAIAGDASSALARGLNAQ